MLTEAELQKQWESLTFTDDFIFSRVMHNKNLTQNTTTRSARSVQLPAKVEAYQTKVETARTFLTMGLSPAQVAQGTGLPLDTVRQLVLTT